jgi:hypothetical protein
MAESNKIGSFKLDHLLLSLIATASEPGYDTGRLVTF